MEQGQEYFARAFVSCSLRDEDRPFIDMVESILEDHRIQPFGTVGKYSVSPINPAEHMKMNIPLADMVVIVATPRYLQIDLQTGNVSHGVSEMVHVETGMAYMANKPVVVFVQEGTSIGNFIPNITEYIILNGQEEDVGKKWNLINSLLHSACKIVLKIKNSESSKGLWKGAKTIAAVYGVFKFLEGISDDDKPKRRRKTKTK